MNPHDDGPIDEIELVDNDFVDASVIDDAPVVEATEIVEPAVLGPPPIEPMVVQHHGFESSGDEPHAEDYSDAPALPDAADFPRSYGYAFALMFLFAGSLCMLIGYGYTINHIPAPWFGMPVIGLGIYFLIFPRSSLVRGAFENMRR